MHNNSWCWRDFFLPFSFTFRSKCWLECLFSSRRTQRMEMNQFSRFFSSSLWFVIEKNPRKIENIRWKVRFFPPFEQPTTTMMIMMMMRRIKEKFPVNDENISIEKELRIVVESFRVVAKQHRLKIFIKKSFHFWESGKTSILMRWKRDEIACAWNSNNCSA